MCAYNRNIEEILQSCRGCEQPLTAERAGMLSVTPRRERTAFIILSPSSEQQKMPCGKRLRCRMYRAASRMRADLPEPFSP